MASCPRWRGGRGRERGRGGISTLFLQIVTLRGNYCAASSYSTVDTTAEESTASAAASPYPPPKALTLLRNHLALNAIFRALANPTRRWILESLCDADAPVTVIAAPLPVSLVSVMRHVRALERARLVRTYKYGQLRICRVEPGALRPLDDWLREQRSRCERRPAPP